MANKNKKRKQGSDHGLYGWVTVSDKGQVAIPRQTRQDLKIKTGDKLMVLCRKGKDGISLIKLDSIGKRLDKLRD